MIKYRVTKEDSDKGTLYYKEFINWSSKSPWANEEKSAKMWNIKGHAINCAKQYNAQVETISFEVALLDIEDYSK